MSIATKALSLMALICAASLPAGAQPPPATEPAPVPPKTVAPAPKPTAQSEAGEPRADTSTGRAGGAPRPAPDSKAAAKSAASKIDRLDLGMATVTGDREQPKVMYIVPWKRSDIGDLSAKPMNSLVDEILAPVDRDVFKREVVYYHAVQSDASQNGASPKPAPQGEK